MKEEGTSCLRTNVEQDESARLKLLVDELLFGRLKHGGEEVLKTEKESFRLHIRSRKIKR